MAQLMKCYLQVYCTVCCATGEYGIDKNLYSKTWGLPDSKNSLTLLGRVP